MLGRCPAFKRFKSGMPIGGGILSPAEFREPAGSENLLAQAVALATASGAKQKEADEIKIEPLPVPSLFGDWMIQTGRRVASVTTRSDDAYM